MKALSFSRPFAWLCAAGIKPVENRKWKTNFRGRIYIHAAMSWYKDADEFIMPLLTPGQLERFLAEKHYPGIIGEVDIVGCKFNGAQPDQSPWAMFGQWGWDLANAVLYKKPIPYKGHLSFFDVTLPNVCVVCGCSDEFACMTPGGPCHWTEPHLCSACAETVHA
jgi:hypothetical protein